MDISLTTAQLNNPRDADDLMSLLLEYALTQEGGGKGLSEFTQENLVTELKKRNDCLVILARHGNTPVGLLTGFEGFSTFACKPLLNIHDLIVSARYRGMQLSQQLLSHAEKISKQRNYCKLTLEVLDGNIVAKNAYLKFGFTAYELDPKMGKALFWEKEI